MLAACNYCVGHARVSSINMENKMKNRSISRGKLIALAALLGLAGCGGGGGGGGSPPSPGPETQTGVFTDAPVQGLAYACAPSGQSGITDANGQFEFADGDQCTFSIGNLALPPVTAALVITPREIAAVIAADAGATQSAETLTQNLFQFFQTLDSDGDASNGITLPSNLDAAFTVTDATAVFDQAPAAFETTLQMKVEEVLAIPGNEDLPIEVVTQEAALQHAAEQAQLLLSGTWIVPPTPDTGDGIGTTVTFLPNNTYLMGELSDPECGPDAFGGAEYGRYSYDPLTGDFVVSGVISDSTGDCGLSGLNEVGLARLRVLGDDLMLDALDTDDLEGGDAAAGQARCLDEDGAVVTMGTDVGQTGYTVEGETYACRYTLARAKGTRSHLATGSFTPGIEGSYLLESDLVLGIASVLTIEQTGTNAFRYLLVESYGENNAPDSEGATDGTARGTFTRNATTGRITVTETLNTIDGDGGLANENDQGVKRLNLVLNGDGNLDLAESRDMNGVETPDFEAELVRVPLAARINASSLVGSYQPSYFDGEPPAEVTQDEESQWAILNFLDSGEFLLGTYEDDATCAVDAADKANGNGIEFGRYQVDSLTGELTTQIPAASATRRFVDTNGECGLVHKGGTSDRYFVHKLSGDDGEGFLFVYVDDSGDDSVPDAEDALIQASAARSIADAMAFAEGSIDDDKGFLVLRPVVSQADANVNSGLNGTWKLTASSLEFDNVNGSLVPVTVTLMGDRYFLTHGTIGTLVDAPSIDGIEDGTFNIATPDGGAKQFCLPAVNVDTATDAGLSTDAQPTTCSDDFRFAIAADLKTFSFDYVEGEGRETATFTRISSPYVIPPAN